MPKTKHGHSPKGQPSAEYHSWVSMRSRCEYPENRSWKYYGGRGIVVCERWRNSFVEFLNDMGARPAGTSLDRIDPNGNYEPTNCRWATSTEQNLNRRPNSVKRKDTRCLTLGAVTKSLEQWAIDLRLTKSAILHRLRVGWTIEATLSTARTKGSGRVPYKKKVA